MPPRARRLHRIAEVPMAPALLFDGGMRTTTLAALSVIALLAVGCGTQLVADSTDPQTKEPAPISSPVEQPIDEVAPSPDSLQSATGAVEDVPPSNSGESASSGASQTTANPPRPVAPAVDGCDEPDFAGVDWQARSEGHFVIHYLPGTAAERDFESIVTCREAAYARIRTRLALTAEPVIDVYLSPNRLAALAHDVGTGLAYPGSDRYEALYTGSSLGFEAQRCGHELVHLLAYYLDPESSLLPLLDEGLAELLDGSDRDQHVAYAMMLTAGYESRVHLVDFQGGDVWGNNYGRAGSFTQLIADFYGETVLLAVLRAARVNTSSGCVATAGGCLYSGADLANYLDSILVEAAGVSLAELQRVWQLQVDAALALPPALDDASRADIAWLVALTDDAISTDDPALYRATMEGFYCDWGSDSLRVDIARRAVTAYPQVWSEIVAVYPLGIQNFPAAYALALRHDSFGTVRSVRYYFEQLPSGWRVTWSDDWQ